MNCKKCNTKMITLFKDEVEVLQCPKCGYEDMW